MGVHDDQTVKGGAITAAPPEPPAAPDPSTKWRSRRWLTGIGTAAALFVSQFGIQVYLAVAKAATLEAMAWYFFATYGLAAGVALGYITAKTYRDVVLAKLGTLKPK